MHRELAALIAGSAQNRLLFQDVMTTIRRHYECRATGFRTGVGTDREVVNTSGSNAASCQLLAFARRLNLDVVTTLGLYGEHYRSVLEDPEGTSHANIRAFMTNAWDGVSFEEDPLRLRGPG